MSEIKERPLFVSEHFYSIQGEGKYQGKSAIFLRLTGCNLLCKGSFICDTIPVWQTGVKHSIDSLIQLFKDNGYINRLKDGSHLVITGGEPLLQQEKITLFITALIKEMGKAPIIEIETNGTIQPNFFLQSLTEVFNISPKLKNSGEPEEKRKLNFNPEDLQTNYILKFVVGNSSHLMEIKEIREKYNIPRKNIYLMPEAENQKELGMNLPLITQFALDKGYNVSNRLHIQVWNKKTGV